MRSFLIIGAVIAQLAVLPAQFVTHNLGGLRGTVTSVNEGDVTSGLIAEWRFDDGSGDVLTDYVGSNNGELGSASGADANDPDWDAQGLAFVRTNNDRVRIPAFQDVTGTWTLVIVAAWDDTEFGTLGHNIFSQEDGTGTGRTWSQITAATPDLFQSVVGGSATNHASNPTTGFHTFTVSYASGTVKLYIDGGSPTSAARTAEAATGQHKFGVSKTDINGYNNIIAWGRMYDRALSDGEVATVHSWLKANIGRSITLP